MRYGSTRARRLALAVATCVAAGSACSSESDGDHGTQVGNTCAAGTSCMQMPGAGNPGAGAGGSAMPAPPSSTVPSGTAGVAGTASGGGGTAGTPPATMAGAGGSTDMQVDASTPVDTPPPTPSSGCSASEWPASGNHTIDVDGTPRDYIVKIPDAYAPDTPHRVVFAWHGLGGTAESIASGFRGGYYGLEARSSGTTIFATGQGLETSSGGAGWPNTDGRDIAFVRAMLDWLRTSYCIDEGRIFSTGMSYGGIMSNTIGCQLGDVFRAIAPIAGSGPRSFGGGSCVGQVAAWLAHGNQDTVVSFESGVASRDHWIMTNGCGSETMPVAPENCVVYQGCDDGHPVHWCEFDGGHTVPAFASEAIWNFFAQF